MLSLHKPKSKLSMVNSILLGLIILVNLYTIMLPLSPPLVVMATNPKAKQTQVAQRAASSPEQQGDRLIVPSIALDQPFYQGDESVLEKGLWLRPKGSTPDQGSNTVIVAHRFTYHNALNNFYFLNKMSIGDPIVVFWQNQKYVYKVDTINIVAPTELSVEAPSRSPKLTLYTCTPLWDPKERLVVTATIQELAQ